MMARKQSVVRNTARAATMDANPIYWMVEKKSINTLSRTHRGRHAVLNELYQ